MLKIKYCIASLILVIGASACRTEVIDIQNNQIPEELVTAASQLQGVYDGEFNRRGMSVQLQVSGNREVSLSTSGDWLSAQCKSSAAALRKIYFTKSDTGIKLKYLSFEFDPGLCPRAVDGRRMIVSLYRGSHDQLMMDVELFDRKIIVPVCGWEPITTHGHHGHPHTHQVWQCHNEWRDRYITGRFVKHTLDEIPDFIP